MARAKLLLQEIETYAQNIGDTIRDPLLILDRDLCIKSANRAFYKTFQASPEETEDRRIGELGNGQWDLPPLLDLLGDIVPTKGHFDDYEVTHDSPCIGQRTMLLNARKLYRPGNRTVLIVLAIEDVTERRRVERQLAAAHQRDRRIASTLQRALLFMPSEDAFPGLEVKMLHEAASEKVLVGDVMGRLNSYLSVSHRLFHEGGGAAGMEPPPLGVEAGREYRAVPFRLEHEDALLLARRQ